MDPLHNRPMAIPKRPKGLGMGLEALLGPSTGAAVTLAPAAAAQERAERLPSSLPLSSLRPGRYQPRTRMDEGSLYELAQSIQSQGVMQPILVRPLEGSTSETPRYEIIAGERRFRAAQIAGLEDVPVLVKAVPDEAAAVMALIENIQREDLNPLEEAQGLKRLVDEFKLTHEEAAKAVGRSRSAASNLLRLLNLSEPVQKMLLAGDLDMGHARALLALAGAEQILVANQVVARKLSVRDAEKLVAHHDPDRIKSSKGSPVALVPTKSRDIVRIEERIADRLAAPVEIRLKKATVNGQPGEIAIAFHSLDELEGVLQRLSAGDAGT
jgi:ParB family transcriptional regulator, chromosome partitioning protein